MDSCSMHRLARYSCAVALCIAATSLFPAEHASAATTIVVQHSGQCLDVRGGPGATQDGALIEQWHCTGSSNQNWTLQDAGGGRFRLVAENSGKCVEPVSQGMENSTGLKQMTCDGTTGQLWSRQATSTAGVYEFVHVVSGKCMDVPSASTEEGKPVNIFDCKGGINQQWAIASTEDTSPASEIIVKHSNMCLDVRGGPQATGDNALLEQWPCSGATNESFTLKDMGTAQLQIIAKNSGKCLQPASDGVSIEQFTCGSASATNQLWKRKAGKLPGEYQFVNVANNQCLDVPTAGSTKGEYVKLGVCDGSAHQTWSVGKPLNLELRAGEYWGLPTKYPKKSPYGGLNQIWGPSVRWSPVTDLHWTGGHWKDLNPSEGVYDNNKIETTTSSGLYGLNELGAQNKKALIWTSNVSATINGVRTDLVPQWVVNKCANAGKPISVIKNGSSTWGYAIWETCPRTELVRFIKGMFSKYKSDSRVAYAYASTLNAGEFWMPHDAWVDATNKGLTPAILKDFAEDIIDAWVYALGAKKVVWTSAGGWSEPGTADDDVDTYALNTLGTQLREGNAESVNSNLQQTLIGQDYETPTLLPLDAPSGIKGVYLKAKPIEDVGRDGLDFYGDEFEIARYAGVFDDFTHYRLSVLNMLRKGMNYAIFPKELRVTDNDATYPDFALLRDYFRQSAGYPIGQAPDAWAVLQVFYNQCYTNRRYHNYEKFVVQREVSSGGRTKSEVSDRYDWPTDTYGLSDNCKPGVSYHSKRTDHATGNDYIYFDVASGFPSSSSDYRIAVYYKDVGTATWSLQYTDASAATQSTTSVTNTNDGKWKTAIFTVPGISFANALSGMDFRIYNGGSADVTIGSVRIIRY